MYTAFQIAVPLTRWSYAAFKAIAWFGFYAHYSAVGIGYIFIGLRFVWNLDVWLSWLNSYLDTKDEERRERQEESQQSREDDRRQERPEPRPEEGGRRQKKRTRNGR